MKRENQLKRWSKAKCRDESARALQKLRRLEEADQFGFCVCVSCGKRKHWTELQGGHFIGGRTNSVLFVEDNIHPQCPAENKWATSSDAATNYGLYMLERYGAERVEELKRMRHASESFSKEELLDMRDEYLARIKTEMKRLDDGILPSKNRN